MAYNDLFSTFGGQFRLGGRYGVMVGVIRDRDNNPVAGASVMAFRTSTRELFGLATSDGSGNYRIDLPLGEDAFIVAYDPGTPDISGTTVNTLRGV